MTATELLSELLRTDTVNPPGAEMPAARILESYLQDAGLETKILESPEGRPSLVARLEGPSDASPLVLLSHTDVVGVEGDKWSHDPFGGEIADGSIWGRGALDMKGIAVMHAVAAAELARAASSLKRTVIVVAVADEEAGGVEGAGWLVENHAALVGLGGPPPEVLGEGAYGLSGILARPLMPIVLGEKSVLWLDLTATGTPGHGALPPQEQAPANLAKAITKVAGFGKPRVHPVMREQFATLAETADGVTASVFKLLASGVGSTAATALKSQLRARGTIATLVADTATPTQLAAGYKHNVVPGTATASLDCRLLPDTDPDDYTAAVQKKVGSLGVIATRVAHHGSPVSARSPLFEILAEESRSMPERPIVVPSLTSAMTDVRYWRQRGAHGYGWGPLVVTPELLGTIHGHDERVPVDAFERAVESMTRVVARAAG
jgi:acetylornithine deacetylase/succinyl-diaminopimelate desuccinylase-like protein